MLDEELYAVMRTVDDEDVLTPFQEKIQAELRHRLSLQAAPKSLFGHHAFGSLEMKVSPIDIP